MSLTKIPEFGVSFDPDQIVKIDLVRESDGVVRIEISLKDQENPAIHKFPDMEEAKRFYNAVWELRQLDEFQTNHLRDIG